MNEQLFSMSAKGAASIRDASSQLLKQVIHSRLCLFPLDPALVYFRSHSIHSSMSFLHAHLFSLFAHQAESGLSRRP